MEWMHSTRTNSYRAQFGVRTYDVQPALSGRWEAWYGKPGKRLHLGSWATAEEATRFCADMQQTLEQGQEHVATRLAAWGHHEA